MTDEEAKISETEKTENGFVELKGNKGFNVSMNVIILTIAISAAYLLAVGLISGLVFRKINACESNSNAQGGGTITPTTVTTTSSTPMTVTTTSSTPITLTTIASSPMTVTTTASTPITLTTIASSPMTVTTTVSTPMTVTTTTTTTTSTPITLTTTSSTPISLSTTTSTLMTVTTTSSTTPKPIYENIRLPDIFQPYNYDLDIKVDFTPMGVSASNFSGTVKISFTLKSSTQEILFHADPGLKINDPIVIRNLMTNSDQTVGPNEMHLAVKNEYYYIKLNNALSPGNFTITLNYVSTYKSLIGNRGLFAAQYLEDGQRKTMIATKFEPTDARKAFPCFDEPQLKATYDFSIQHPVNTVALANFNVLSVSNITSQNAVQTTFATTFPMSTYLVAWAVLPPDWGYEEMFTQKDNKPVRVYGRKYAKEQGLLLHAVYIAKKSLDFYENVYFNISEAVPPKIDLIAVPDFPTGAMENWGLIGFRETSLLYSNKTNSAANKQSVSLTIAHEVAHFWFGNLVTCKWWNDLWLNEAMATFLEYKTINHIFPEWTMYEQVIMLEGVPVMWDDAFPSSHPVEANVETPDQINNVFDSITYSKGQSVLRQLENVVGAEGFRLGLIAYLTNNKYSSGIASEFYNSLQLPSDMAGQTTPSNFMATWLLQMNYPKVEINLTRTTNMTTISFKQSRFLLTPFADGLMPTYVSPFNYTWQIYLRCTAGGTYNPAGGVEQHLDGIFDFTIFMNAKTAEYISNGRQLTWVKCNPDFSSFYTIKYDEGVYDALITVLGANHKAFSIGDRANILHDSYLLAYQGSLGYSTTASISSYLSMSETDYIPWRVFLYHSTLIAKLLEHRSGFLLFANYANSVAEGLSSNWILDQELNNPNDHLKSLLKTYTVEFLCRMQDENCLRNMTSLYTTIPPNYFFNPNNIANPVPPSIRGSVYRYHLQNTYDYRDWFNVLHIYLLSGDPVERSNSLSGMSYTRSQWLIQTYLEELRQNDSSIIKQDFFTVLNAVARNPSGRHLAWYFYRHYWNELVAKFGLGDRTFGRSIKAITDTFGTMYQLDEMNEFFANYPQAGAGEDPRKQAREAVLTNIFWIKQREPELVDSFVGPLAK